MNNKTQDRAQKFDYKEKHFCNDLRIIDDKIYIIDQDRTMRFYIYKMSMNANRETAKNPKTLSFFD